MSSESVRPISSTTRLGSGREAGQLGPDLPGSQPKRRQKKAPRGVGHPFHDEPAIGMTRRDGDAGQDASHRIAHDAPNFARVRLCGYGPADDSQKQVRQQCRDTPPSHRLGILNLKSEILNSRFLYGHPTRKPVTHDVPEYAPPSPARSFMSAY